MTQQLVPALRHLVSELPAHKRQAATTFFSDAHGLVSSVLNPLLPPTRSYKNWGVTIPQVQVNEVICATRFYGPILTDGVGLRPYPKPERRSR